MNPPPLYETQKGMAELKETSNTQKMFYILWEWKHVVHYDFLDKNKTINDKFS